MSFIVKNNFQGFRAMHMRWLLPVRYIWWFTCGLVIGNKHEPMLRILRFSTV